MGPVGTGIANPIDDGHLALVVQLLDGAECRVKTDLIVDGQDSVLGYAYRGTIVVVERICVGDDRVHVVVGAGQLHHYQNWVFLRRGHGLSSWAGMESL